MKIWTLLPILVLLLVQLLVRAHNPALQEVFVDEGYHLTRAAVVWDFDQHPARFSHGKLLTYFWLGLFETDPLIYLPVGRLAIALFTLLNGALLYLLGRLLGNHRVGLLALAIYAILPLAFFFERMALADSFAATFAGLVAWRSLVFVKKPRLLEGALIGVLLALAMMAKLTMGLIPFLPVAASLIYYRWQAPQADMIAWGKRYLPALFVAAGAVIVMWLPILIPAALAIDSDDPFILVDPTNLQQLNEAAPVQSLQTVAQMLSYYTTWFWFGILAVAMTYLFLPKKSPDGIRQHSMFLLAWIMLGVMLPLFAATLVRTRYLMPLTIPAALLIALAADRLWRVTAKNTIGWGIRLAVVGALIGWAVIYAIPFAYTASTDPKDLALSDEDWVRYMSGNFSGDALRGAAEMLNGMDWTEERLVTTWGTCQLLFLYVEEPATCLPATTFDEDSEADLLDFVESERAAGRSSAVMVLNNRDSFLAMDEVEWELIELFQRPISERPVQVWRLRWD